MPGVRTEAFLLVPSDGGGGRIEQPCSPDPIATKWPAGDEPASRIVTWSKRRLQSGPDKPSFWWLNAYSLGGSRSCRIAFMSFFERYARTGHA